MDDLETLVVQAKIGDERAYETIVRRFQDMAVGYGYALLGDWRLAEDAAQEAFLKAYQTMAALREPAAFPGWFRRILFQRADRLRRGKRISTISLDSAVPVASNALNPAQIIERQAIQDQVVAAITTLSEPQCQVVTLFFISEYSQKEISVFLEIPVATVKTRLHTARKLLKERIMTMLQDNIFHQRPSKDDTFLKDLQAMLLLVKARPPAQLADFPSPVDLRELLAVAEIRTNTRLWTDHQGQVVGFAIAYTQYSQLLFEIAPAVAKTDIAAQMITWETERIREAGQKTITVNCRDHNTDRIALLKACGFKPQPTRTLRMRRALDDPLPAPNLPAGFTIRHVEGESEVEDLVALHQAAFGTENMTVEYRLAMMRVPKYDSTLDLVAVAPDGRLAAFCVGGISDEENDLTGRQEGWTEPVGTHPDFQRRGLARALMLTCFSLFKQRGLNSVGLGTWGENVAMRQVARSLGFQVESETIFFEKAIY